MTTISLRRLFLLTILAGGHAAAQDVIIDECAVPLDAAQAIEFRPDGDVAVSTSGERPACLGVLSGGGGAALATSKTEVDAGETFDIDYAIPDTPFSCTLTANNTPVGATLTPPSGTVAAQTISTDTTYRVDCTATTAQGDAGAFATALVDFLGSTPPPPPPSGELCAQLPPNFTRNNRVDFNRNSVRGAASTYEEAFGPYPLADGFGGSTFDFDIPKLQYVSLPFSIPADIDPNSFVQLQWVFFAGTSEGTSVSISTCVGGVLESQTVPQADGKSCKLQGTDAGGRFIFGTSPSARCVLEPGQTYYLNIADYNEATGTATCNLPDRQVCTWKVSPSAFP